MTASIIRFRALGQILRGEQLLTMKRKSSPIMVFLITIGIALCLQHPGTPYVGQYLTKSMTNLTLICIKRQENEILRSSSIACGLVDPLSVLSQNLILS